MLPVYARAKDISFSVREGWLSGCLERLQKADDNKITLAICFPKESEALNIPLAMYGNAFVFESHPATGARLWCKVITQNCLKLHTDY